MDHRHSPVAPRHRAALQPAPVYGYAFEAASYAELGETAAAEAALKKLLAAEPAASLNLIRDLHPNADGEVLEREIEAPAVRAAGAIGGDTVSVNSIR